MDDASICECVRAWKEAHGVRIYAPAKYFRGLRTCGQIHRRLNEMRRYRHATDPGTVAYKTDRLVVAATAPRSSYHDLFEERWKIPASAALAEKSRATGVPLWIIEKVFQKGVAAWKTGHRVGATAVQWGSARVSSFLVLGCAAMSADASLLRAASACMTPAKKRRFFAQPIACPPDRLARFSKWRGEEIVSAARAGR